MERAEITDMLIYSGNSRYSKQRRRSCSKRREKGERGGEGEKEGGEEDPKLVSYEMFVRE